MLRYAFLVFLVLACASAMVRRSPEDAEEEDIPIVTQASPVVDEIIPIPSEEEARGAQAATSPHYSLYTVKLNWYQAYEMCLQMGQRLATFNNQEEYNELVNLIRSNIEDLNANFWTAGSDLGERDKYVWMSTGKSLGYEKWFRGEPNHGNGDEFCIDLRAQYHYRMNDNTCTRPQYVACEKVH